MKRPEPLFAFLRRRRRTVAFGASLGAIALLVLFFYEISDAALDEEGVLALDLAVLRAMRSDAAGSDAIGPPWLERAVHDLSALGSGAVLTVVVIIAVALLVLAERRTLALFFAGASLASGALMALLKQGFGRARPDVVTPIGLVHGHSFPSGHTLLATAIFMLLGMLVSRILEPTRLRWSVLVIAAVLALVVGLTRVYLGVHYPTDVLAGWTMGLAWASLCGTAFLVLEARGIVADRPAPRGIMPHDGPIAIGSAAERRLNEANLRPAPPTDGEYTNPSHARARRR